MSPGCLRLFLEQETCLFLETDLNGYFLEHEDGLFLEKDDGLFLEIDLDGLFHVEHAEQENGFYLESQTVASSHGVRQNATSSPVV